MPTTTPETGLSILEASLSDSGSEQDQRREESSESNEMEVLLIHHGENREGTDISCSGKKLFDTGSEKRFLWGKSLLKTGTKRKQKAEPRKRGSACKRLH
jgi:hypothetical protein